MNLLPLDIETRSVDPAGPQASADSIMVGRSWIQSNRAAFLFGLFPWVMMLDKRSGRSTTTWEIPELDNAMAKGLPHDWEPGDAFTDDRESKSITVSAQPIGKATRKRSRVIGPDVEYRFEDAENQVPIHLSLAFQGIDKLLNQFLTTQFGADFTFTNGGGALDNKTDYANQSPILDINRALQPLRKYASMDNCELRMVMDWHVALVLAAHPDYTGAGTGSAIASQLTMDAFVRVFEATHMVRLIITGVSSDTVQLGQASTLNHVHNGLMWAGVVDVRGSMDKRMENTMVSPDGAVCICLGREPRVIDWEPAGKEVQFFQARWSMDIISPRGASFGVVFKASGAGGIFTTLPT